MSPGDLDVVGLGPARSDRPGQAPRQFLDLDDELPNTQRPQPKREDDRFVVIKPDTEDPTWFASITLLEEGGYEVELRERQSDLEALCAVPDCTPCDLLVPTGVATAAHESSPARASARPTGRGLVRSAS